MRKTISHHLLEQIGDPRKMSQRNLDAALNRVERSVGISDKGITNKVIAAFIPQEGVSKLMSFSEVTDTLGSTFKERTNTVQVVLDKLEEEALIQSTPNCEYRISSNVLAAQLFNKIEADRMVLRKVENFVHDRYAIYQEKNLLLTQQDLNYISPYLASISVSEEELKFISKSKQELEKRKKRRAVIVSLVITALSILSIVAFAQYLRANKALKAAEEATIQAQNEKEKAEELSADNAKLARANAVKARSNEELAIKNEALANEAKKEAHENALLAEDKRILAEVNRIEAERNASLAFENAKYAKEEAERAEAFSQLAQKNADLAKQEAERAAQEKEQAAKNKTLEQIAFSHSLAKQAAQMGDEQAELKSLMAHTAFKINEDTPEGDIYQQDIYEALYQSVKSINQAKGNDNFNTINNERGSINDVVFAKTKEGNTFYTVSSSGHLKQWIVNKWKEIDKPKYTVKTLIKLNRTLNTLALSDDGKWLAVGGELPSILLINLKRKKEVPLKLNLHEGKEIFDLTFLPNTNKLISLGADKMIKQYNLDDKTTKTLASAKRMITAFTLSSDPPYLLYYGTINGELHENDLAGQDQQLVISSVTETARKITAIDAVFYNGRRQLFIGHTNGLIKILEAKPGGWFPTDRNNVVTHFISRFHTAQISDIQHSFGGHYIGVTSYDGRSTLWDVFKSINDVYYQPMVFSGDSWATALEFSDHSAHVVVGYREGDLVFFNPDPEIYADAICNEVQRDMSQDEWDLYIGKKLDPSIYRNTCKK